MAGRWIVAALLLVTLSACLPQPGVAAGDTLPFRFPAGTDSVANVSALADAGDVVRFSFQEADFGLAGLRGALVHLAKGAEQIDVSLAADAQPSGQRTWSGDLPVATPDLVLGAWQATLQVVKADGTQATPAPARTLTVTGTDALAPQIAFPEKEGSTVRIGGFGSVVAVVNDTLLRSVTFRLPGMLAPLKLPAPYHLSASTFTEGAQDLVLTAVDRAGNTATANVTVVLDRTAPALAASVPARVFRGVPAAVSVELQDASPYTLTVALDDANGTTLSASGQAGTRLHSFTLPSLALGNHSLTVTAIDRVGNVRSAIVQTHVEVPETDSTISQASFLQNRTIAGEPLTLRVTLEQERGVTALDLGLDYTGAATGNRTVSVPGPGAKVVDIPLQLPVGQHVLTLTVAAPSDAVELDDADQQRTLTTEVFFGRLRDGDETYMVRPNALGTPGFAVGANKTYAMRLAQSAGSIVYEFTTDDNRTLRWDPLTPDATAPTPPSPAPPADGKDTPMPGAAVLLAALAALALLRRRKP